VEKIAQKGGLLFIKMPKVNNHPLGEKSPNLIIIPHHYPQRAQALLG
jgi:hypothetical protein